jgi:hypothetical protein
MELSYFKLLLSSYLEESHPDKAENRQFIHERSELATESYTQSVASGYTHSEATEQANVLLYQGLHFSKYDTLYDIFSEEFSETVTEEQLAKRTLELLPICADVFVKYDLCDDFTDSPEYDKLYSELTGKLAEYGI